MVASDRVFALASNWKQRTLVFSPQQLLSAHHIEETFHLNLIPFRLLQSLFFSHKYSSRVIALLFYSYGLLLLTIKLLGFDA